MSLFYIKCSFQIFLQPLPFVRKCLLEPYCKCNSIFMCRLSAEVVTFRTKYYELSLFKQQWRIKTPWQKMMDLKSAFVCFSATLLAVRSLSAELSWQFSPRFSFACAFLHLTSAQAPVQTLNYVVYSVCAIAFILPWRLPKIQRIHSQEVCNLLSVICWNLNHRLTSTDVFDCSEVWMTPK